MSEKEILEEARRFADQIMTSDTYNGYLYQLERIKRQPALYEKVNEFRQRSFVLQNAPESDDLFERLEAFEEEYERFRENPIVDDFLTAELSVCRMMQDIYGVLAEQIDFD